MGSRFIAFAPLVVSALLAGCGGDRHAPSASFEDCRLPKLSTAARCTTVEVPENRDRPGRTIRLFVAVLPATTLSPERDPLLILAGGPGQSASSLAPLAARLVEVRRRRDVVLVDQRGTGRSAPLACSALELDSATEMRLEPDPMPRLERCLAELAAAGIDPSQYTTAAWIADLEAVRSALDIPRWNLWGGSYGTRVALEYVRRHPDRVRTMVLDGVAPPSMKISSGIWPTREQALDALFAACAGSSACGKAHPDLAATLDKLAVTLAPDGRDVTVADPQTGAPTSVRMTFDALLWAIHPLTYVPDLAALIPEVLDRAADGDFAPLFATVQLVTSELSEQMNVALHYSVTCAEDTPRITPEERASLRKLRSGSLAEKAMSVCDAWPKRDVPADMFAPLRSDVPTLLISGALDPVTPPAYAEEVAKTLSNARHIVAGGYGHIVSLHACGPRLIATFVERGGASDLPQSCIDYFAKSTRPPLWSDRLGPAS